MKTVLCVPGHDEKKVTNCRKYGADLILFDLEDSVPDSMKDRAREIVAANITKDDAVRVNRDSKSYSAIGVGMTGRNDLEMISELPFAPQSIWLPKHTAQPNFGYYYKFLNHGDDEDRREFQFVLIVETPRLLVELRRCIEWSSVITGLAFGAADFAAYMNVPPSSPQVQYARQQVALAAAALGVPAYDSPCTTIRGRIDDPRSLFNETIRAMELGYQWKGAIHPSQIEEIHVSGRYNPGDRQLIDLYDRQNEAVIVVGDQVIAPPMIRAARKRLEETK